MRHGGGVQCGDFGTGEVFIGGHTTTTYSSTAGKRGVIQAPSSSRASLIDSAPLQYKANLLPYASNPSRPVKPRPPKHLPHPTHHRASSPTPIRRLLDAFRLRALNLCLWK
ncbi:hypothetical protein BV22DRAFT_934696 [Leucogyrophana mollusca]|uniref:Uncharacterized protein n=1 Tax=Leucogyrophana mollusca TaxID=85980 RepID=A0ACB8AW93_9AGAM|nr:hypothetical protein BV22DRAFT_934696 [Leucogyrophana mollusca]